MLAERPPPKSTVLAYVLWLLAPPLGLHHLYLGRDAHAVLHASTLGAVGLGWCRDLFCLPRYVAIANEDPAHTSALRAEQRVNPTPSRGVSRLLAQLVLGMYFAYLTSCLLPPPGEPPIPGLFDVVPWGFLESASQALGASSAVFAIGAMPPQVQHARMRPLSTDTGSVGRL